ncbi:MAG: hypothetical protein WCO94_14090 [Verrucomicrobiota bacterium]
MKHSLLAALAFLPCLAFAGTSSTATPPDVTKELSVMAGKLKLSPAQQDKIRPILVAEWNKKKSIETSTLTEQQKHDQIGANHRAACQKIKLEFTPAQMEQIERDMNHSPASSTKKGS